MWIQKQNQELHSKMHGFAIQKASFSLRQFHWGAQSDLELTALAGFTLRPISPQSLESTFIFKSQHKIIPKEKWVKRLMWYVCPVEHQLAEHVSELVLFCLYF